MIVLDVDADRRRGGAGRPARAAVVVLGTVRAEELAGAQLVLPVTNVAEENGTFVNRDGRVQRYQQASGARHGPAGVVGGGRGAGRPGPDSAAPGTGAEAFAALGQ